MIPITLSNGETIEVENESSKLDFVIRTDSFSEIDAWKDTITEENINGAEMESEKLSDLIFVNVTVTLEEHNLRTDFLFREKTENEVLKDRLAEAEEAINYLLMGENE